MDCKNGKRKRLFEEQGGECFWCYRICVLGRSQTPDMFTVDHIVPQYRGGGDEEDNLVGACFRCNQLRSKIEESIVHGKLVQGFGKMRDIEKYLPIMSVQEVLVDLKERIEPRKQNAPHKKRAVDETPQPEGLEG